MCADEYSGSVARYWSKCSRRLSKCLGLPCPESSVDNKRRHWPTVFCQSVLDYLQLVFVQPRRQTDKHHRCWSTKLKSRQTVYFSQKCTEAIRANLCQLKSRTATVTACCEWTEIQSGPKISIYFTLVVFVTPYARKKSCFTDILNIIWYTSRKWSNYRLLQCAKWLLFKNQNLYYP